MRSSSILLALLTFLVSASGAVDSPVAKPDGGSYDHLVSVKLSATPKKADIRYTIDGTAITAQSPIYDKPIVLATTTTLRMQAFLTGAASPEVVVTYVISGVKRVGATPIFTPAPGTYSVPISVAISTITPDTVLHYSLDGTEPTKASPKYATPLPLSQTTTVRARGFSKNHHEGAIAVGVYAFQAAQPTAAPMPGIYGGPIDVVLSTVSPAAVIRYTLNGSIPTAASPLANGPVHLSTSATITARAFRTGWMDSTPLVAAYVIADQSVNQPPSFVKGSDQTVLEDSGAHSVSGWATAISPGPVSEAGQSVSFLVSADNPALFAVQPAVSSTGVLTFTPAADANGIAVLSVQAMDDGGTDHGGMNASAPQTATITITSANDAPSFSKGVDQAVLEDAGAQIISGWATAISPGPADESDQTVTFSVTTTNASLFATQPAISETGALSYALAADASGTATISVVARDDGGTGDGGIDASGAQTATITVTPVNDAPSFTTGADQIAAADAGMKTVSGWATNLSPGPANESSQTLTFILSTDHPEFFTSNGQPAVSPTGTLSFTPAAPGTAVVTIRLQDSGGTVDGGVDTSGAQTFQIVVGPANGGVDTPPTIGPVVLTISGGLTGDQQDTVGGELLHFTDTHHAITFTVSAPVQGGMLTDITVSGSDGQSISALSGSGSLTPTGDGRIELVATATAASTGGSTASQASVPVIVIADGTPPVVTDFQALQDPANLASGVSMRSSLTDDAAVVYLNGASWADDVTVRSGHGINAFPRTNFALRIGIDDLSGVGTSASQTGYAQANQTTRLMGASSAPGSPMAVRLSGFEAVSESATYASDLTLDQTPGLYTIHASITDRAGNTTEIDLFKVWVDVTAPVVVLAVQPLQTPGIPAPPFIRAPSDGDNRGLAQLSPALFVAASPDAALLWQGQESDATLMIKMVGTPEVPPSTGAPVRLPAFQLKQGIDLITPYAAAKDWTNAIGQTNVTALDRAGNKATSTVLAQLRVMHAPDISSAPTATPIKVRLPIPASEQITEQPTTASFTAVYEAGGVQKSCSMGASQDNENVAWVFTGTSVTAPHLGTIAGSLVVDKDAYRYLATLDESPITPAVLNVPPSWQTSPTVSTVRLKKDGLLNPFYARTALTQTASTKPIQDTVGGNHMTASERAVYVGTSDRVQSVVADADTFWAAHPGLLDDYFDVEPVDSTKLVWMRFGLHWPTSSSLGIDQAVESSTTAYARPVGHWVVGIPQLQPCNPYPIGYNPVFMGPLASEEDTSQRDGTVSLDRTIDPGAIRIGYRRETISQPPTGPVPLPVFLGSIGTNTFFTDPCSFGPPIRPFSKDWVANYMSAVDGTPGSTGTVRSQAGYHGLDILKIENDVIATGAATLRIAGCFITSSLGPNSVPASLDAIRFLDPSKETTKLAELGEPAVEQDLKAAQAELIASTRNTFPPISNYTAQFSQPLAQDAYAKSSSIVTAQTNAQQALASATQDVSLMQSALSNAQSDLASAQAELTAATTASAIAAAQQHVLNATALVASTQSAYDAARIVQADASGLANACTVAVAERSLANQSLNSNTVQGHVDCCTHVITAMHMIAWQYADVTMPYAQYQATLGGPALRASKIAVIGVHLLTDGINGGVKQTLAADVIVGEKVVPEIYHVDVKCGAVKSYGDELSQLTAGANGAHRMKQALAVIKVAPIGAHYFHSFHFRNVLPFKVLGFRLPGFAYNVITDQISPAEPNVVLIETAGSSSGQTYALTGCTQVNPAIYDTPFWNLIISALNALTGDSLTPAKLYNFINFGYQLDNNKLADGAYWQSPPYVSTDKQTIPFTVTDSHGFSHSDVMELYFYAGLFRVQSIDQDDKTNTQWRTVPFGTPVYGGNVPITADNFKIDVSKFTPFGYTVANYVWSVSGPGSTNYQPPGNQRIWDLGDLKPIPGTLNFKLTINFTDGSHCFLDRDVKVGVRTDDIVVVAFINPAGVPLDATGVTSSVLAVFPVTGSSLDLALLELKELGFLANRNPFYPDYDPLNFPEENPPLLNRTDREYLLHWLFKYGANHNTLPAVFSSDGEIRNFRDADKTKYKLFQWFQAKYTVNNDATGIDPDPSVSRILHGSTSIGWTKDPIRPGFAPAGTAGPREGLNGTIPSGSNKIGFFQISDGSPEDNAVNAFNTLMADLDVSWNNIGSLVEFPFLDGGKATVKVQIYPTYNIYINNILQDQRPQDPEPANNFNSSPYYRDTPQNPAPYIPPYVPNP